MATIFLILTNPLVLSVLANSTFTLAAGYTSRGSFTRYAVVAALLTFGCFTPLHTWNYMHSTGWFGRALSGGSFWLPLVAIDRLILKGWDYEHYTPRANSATYPKDSKQKAEPATLPFQGSRGEFGAEATSPRGTGTWWQVKNIPHFSSSDPDMVPSRAAFILVQSVAAISSYVIRVQLTKFLLGMKGRPSLNPEHQYLFSNLGRVSTTDFSIRVVTTIIWWAAHYTYMQFFFSLGALMAAISKPQDIKLWRPFFGPPGESYNLRGFWGSFWHQTLRPTLEGLSDYLVHTTLSMPRRGVVQRYTKILSAFAISGLMHSFSDLGGSGNLKSSGAMRFFIMQGVGIMMEDAVIALWTRLIPRKTAGAGVLDKLIGFTWVLLFLSWTSPPWMYPNVNGLDPADAFMDLTALKAVTGRKRF